eukprot:CAMPEP_0197048824 /NCGR_PEP_ID=MMETSP1384-20130603/24089_1 /TAXON_ID=29189 /ORGANISM="Ammonia sp." /LENGTH=135 /DNA_ID=CAMNT_0042481017 /DNA_START=1 /DNA_END=404 /DNA_ORIENTATION=+
MLILIVSACVAVVLLLLLCLAVYCCFKKNRSEQQEIERAADKYYSGGSKKKVEERKGGDLEQNYIGDWRGVVVVSGNKQRAEQEHRARPDMEMQARKRESSEQMYIDHGGATNGDLGEELANNKKPSLKQLQLSG